jgi:RimJ/RimL family protein N-acetyltransferase
MFREATVDDLVGLRDLEREANLVGLGHVFPPERFPFPDDAVLARWALVLDEPGVTVLVRDADDLGGTGDTGGAGLALLAAYDDRQLRHLAVHPDHWGQGLASTAVARVLHEMGRRGTTTAELWCLVENHRARRLYEHLGWQPTADRQEAPWPPHPTEMRYTRPVAQAVLRPVGGAGR